HVPPGEPWTDMLNSDRARFDDSRWPLLFVDFPGTLSAQGQEACLAALADYLRRGDKVLMLLDLRRVGMVPLDQRWRQVEWFEAHELLLRERVLGTALVLSSPVVRLAISAMLYFKPLPLPLATFNDVASAEAWVAERLQEAKSTQTRTEG
ncbi:MAG TPA: STAS/SEC14 domain-containing protein, partial [Archangium sp.]